MSDEAVLRTLHVDDLIELVEVLRRDYAAAIADRDRLRAVVDAAVMWQREWEALAKIPEGATHAEQYRVWVVACEVLTARLRLLDVSPTIGDTNSTEGAPHEATGTGVLLPVSTRSADGGPVMPSTPAPQPRPSVGDRATCRWCDQPITFTSSSQLAVDEDSWTHDWPQPGTGYIRRRKCEPDMQSMLAEPAGTPDLPTKPPEEPDGN